MGWYILTFGGWFLLLLFYFIFLYLFRILFVFIVLSLMSKMIKEKAKETKDFLNNITKEKERGKKENG